MFEIFGIIERENIAIKKGRKSKCNFCLLKSIKEERRARSNGSKNSIKTWKLKVTKGRLNLLNKKRPSINKGNEFAIRRYTENKINPQINPYKKVKKCIILFLSRNIAKINGGIKIKKNKYL